MQGWRRRLRQIGDNIVPLRGYFVLFQENFGAFTHGPFLFIIFYTFGVC
jgi:hypothetical protein